ncbi:MAG: DUF805 domain-containing protein [Azospirillaceae bacterium]|nr:DUF805 domain-containing protein [Azospirillaceae bacterium]
MVSTTGFPTWYYADGSERVGPFSESNFLKEIAAGKVKPTTFVFYDATVGWVKLSESPITRLLVPPPPPPPPLPPPAAPTMALRSSAAIATEKNGAVEGDRYFIDVTEWFTFHGRISRKEYWVKYGLCVPLFSLFFAGLDFIAYNQIGIFSVFWAIIIQLALTTASVKRLHDRGRSGWWLLWGIVPIIGPIYLAVELGFLPGVAGDNKYGPNPVKNPHATMGYNNETFLNFFNERRHIVAITLLSFSILIRAATIYLANHPDFEFPNKISQPSVNRSTKALPDNSELGASSQNQPPRSLEKKIGKQYTAILRCRLGSIEYNVRTCFIAGNNDISGRLKITKSGGSKVYSTYEIANWFDEAAKIPLGGRFTVEAMAASTDGIVLSIDIVDEFGNKIYHDEGAELSPIIIDSNELEN